MSNDAFNEGPLKFLKGRCPIKVFSHGQIKAEPRKSQSFGCPVYVLQNALQQGKSIQQWDKRTRVRVYTGRSPFHARSIALVLNITTSRVSPQFHVQFDSRYQTISPHLGGGQHISKWQSICGFTDKKGKSEKNELGLVMPAPDPQVLQDMPNAYLNPNLEPVTGTNHARLKDTGAIGTHSNPADLKSDKQSHFSEGYFDNKDNFQKSADDELKRTSAGVDMYDYKENGDGRAPTHQEELASLEEVGRCNGPHLPPLRRSNHTLVPVIGRRLVDHGFIAQVILCTTIATTGIDGLT
jgi:hypothetical protein